MTVYELLRGSLKSLVFDWMDEYKCDGLATDMCGCSKDDLFVCIKGSPFFEKVLYCELARYRECKKCRMNGKCDYQEFYDTKGCYVPLSKEVDMEKLKVFVKGIPASEIADLLPDYEIFTKITWKLKYTFYLYVITPDMDARLVANLMKHAAKRPPERTVFVILKLYRGKAFDPERWSSMMTWAGLVEESGMKVFYSIKRAATYLNTKKEVKR